MKKYLYTLLLSAFGFVSCTTDIAPEDRLVYVAPPTVGKQVLLVDFTGQRCVNCPLAAEEIEQMQHHYGADTLIAVAIHSGPLGFKGTSTAAGLATDLGDAYYAHWNIDYQPQGVIDYQGKTDYLKWADRVRMQLGQTAPVNIEVETSSTASQAAGMVHLTSLSGALQANLQLWIVEDSIQALQLMPDGSANRNYIHNHVFRDAVNGAWGEKIRLAEGETLHYPFAYTLPEAWRKRYLWLIAFVYDENGVQQVVRKKLF